MFSMLIDGRLTETDARLKVINPSDETVAAEVSDADRTIVDSAVQAAKQAYASWRNTAVDERQALLRKLSAVLQENADELAELLVREQGRPLPLAHFEVGLAQRYLDFYAEQSLDVEILVDDTNSRVELHRKSLGVVAAISPWNAPLYLSLSKVAPALLAGNSVVLKPPQTSPLAVLRFGELVKDIVPAGLLNIICGGNDAGAAMVDHPDVAKVSFTGSTETGKVIMREASSSLKRLTLELGGNDAAIVLPDVDPKAIAPALFGTAFFNSGQVCAIIKRLYVHDDIYDAVCEELAALANGAAVGDDAQSQFGPIQNKAQLDKVLGYLDEAHRSGRVIAGGKRIERPGYFVQLTVVRDIEDGTPLVDEEPFGPILPVVRFSSIDDVVAKANASTLGLGASVWSKDLVVASDIASRIDSGTVWINQHCALDPAIPFPTRKQSGIGVESGREGLLEYTAVQVVNINKASAV
ncbi:aldehyde dehydrogenase family protein [Stutzerimonas stutzeri]|uniref:Aldehyde dehydrogenase family protein n=1 Tax=Stutzerimonas stutzeri TaxID=316 RepID=A0A6I6LS26_STUST|nr:aldehyde dehydrogenase family protein [Stutzerimonas stutzeri]QGZ31176.1 aldehyde dehydrogenase family protein [Stutzerimonas stutzeri]